MTATVIATVRQQQARALRAQTEIEVSWCCEVLGFDVDGTSWTEEDARSEFLTALFGGLDELGFKTENAKRGRKLYHGWNGAHFSHRGTGWGTFSSLSREDESAIDAVACAAWDATAAQLDAERTAAIDAATKTP